MKRRISLTSLSRALFFAARGDPLKPSARLRLWHFMGGLIVVMILITAFPAGAQQGATVNRSCFGVVEAYYRPTDARDLGVGWERIIFEWRMFQPNGPDDFYMSTIPDQWLGDAKAAGRDVVGLLKNTPYWASGTDKLGSPPTGLDLPIDDPNNYWAAFVKRTASTYSERWGVHHWIIYNEPDIRPGDLPWYEFDGGVVDYYKMLKVAYLAAKSVDPQAVIHLAGMAWWVDVAADRPLFLKRLLDYASHDPDAYDYDFFFDVATVHVYFGTLNVWNLITDTRAILLHYGLQKAIWVDETNAAPTLDPDVPQVGNPQYAVTLDQQADYIVQAAALSLAAGVQRFAIYRLFDDHFVPGISEPWGLVRADGSRRPAFQAYQTVVNLFGSTTEAHWFYSDHSSLVVLQQPGQTVYVLWARRTIPVRFLIRADSARETAELISVLGETETRQTERRDGFDGSWFILNVPGATAIADTANDKASTIVVEGRPSILVVPSTTPRQVWIEVRGIRWQIK